MPVTKYRSLTEYRKEVLGERQADIARRMGLTGNGGVSLVERGHLPEPWNRQRWANAYALPVAQFVGLVQAARQRQALRRPASETEPLMATVRGVEGMEQKLPCSMAPGEIREGVSA